MGICPGVFVLESLYLTDQSSTAWACASFGISECGSCGPD